MYTKAVKVWWEGRVLHVVTEEGFHLAYENATADDYRAFTRNLPADAEVETPVGEAPDERCMHVNVQKSGKATQ